MKNNKDCVTIKVELHDGDLDLIKNGKLDYGKAVELVLNHGHGYEVISVEEKDNE